MLTISSHDDGRISAFLAVPPAGRGSGIVLLHERFGVTGFMRGVAAWYAARGHLVACPDLYWRQEPRVELSEQDPDHAVRADALAAGLDPRLAVEDVGSCLRALQDHPRCTGRVAVLGFGLGGALGVRVARHHHPDAVIAYGDDDVGQAIAESPHLECPTLVHLAGIDESTLGAATNAGEGRVVIHGYPGAKPSFTRPGAPEFDPAIAELAGLRSVDFLARHLAPAAARDVEARAAEIEALWDRHQLAVLDARVDEAVALMHPDAWINHVPVLTGGVGTEEIREFYVRRLTPRMPQDARLLRLSRTVGCERVVEEVHLTFTHDIEMDWLLPGVLPTHKRIEVVLCTVATFRGDQIASQHVYWDQASVLVQLGLLDDATAPVVGVRAALKLVDPDLPANGLIARADQRRP